MSKTWAVVAGGPPAWGECSSQALRMAKALWTLGRNVLYIECGGDKAPFRRVLGQTRHSGHDVVADLERQGFFVMRASQLPGAPLGFPELVRRWNCARTSGRAARFLAASGADKVVVFHYDWRLRGLFSAARQTAAHVYECTEDHPNAPGVVGHPLLRRQAARAERKLMKRAVFTVFSSPELAQARPNARSSVVLTPGVDALHFSPLVCADPHEKLKLPTRSPNARRIGFVGRVSERADWAMVRAAAAQTPEWHWIIVGPLDHVRPRGPENLHWVGPVRYDDLPAWMRHWDAGIVPYSPDSPFNQRAWPAKLLEYLAAALPVVASDLPAARDMAARLPGHVFIAADPSASAFVAAARRALALPAWMREAGRTFASLRSWDARAARLVQMLVARGHME